MSSPAMLARTVQFANQAPSTNLLNRYGIGVVPYGVNQRAIEFKPFGTQLPPLGPLIAIDGSRQSYESIPGISLSKRGADYQRYFLNSWTHIQSMLDSTLEEPFSAFHFVELRGEKASRRRQLGEEFAGQTLRELAKMQNEGTDKKGLGELAWMLFDNGNRTHDPRDFYNYLISAVVFANLGDAQGTLMAETGFLMAARIYSKQGVQNKSNMLAMLYELAAKMRQRHMADDEKLNPYTRSAARHWTVDDDDMKAPKDPESILHRMFRSMWHAFAGDDMDTLAWQYDRYADHLMGSGRGEGAAKMRVASVWAGFQLFEYDMAYVHQRHSSALVKLNGALLRAVSDCEDMDLNELADEMSDAKSKLQEFIGR